MAYINKEELLETINEVWERKYARCEWKTLYDLYRMTVRRINRASVVDAVEVVRCKDCYWSKNHRTLLGENVCDCGKWPSNDAHRVKALDDYCSEGYRRTENET